jgi:hypothetical protein
MYGNGRRCFMIGVIQVPVCVTEEVVKQAVIPLIIVAQNIRPILLHWQKAMGRKASVLQKQRI